MLWARTTGDTAVRAGSAADVYSAAKATRNEISNKCLAAGYRFWPIVHEIQGGMAKDANAAMRAICDAVGKKENTDATTVRVEFLGRLAAVTTRAATRAVQKRTTKKPAGTTSDLPAVRQVMRAVEPEINQEVELEVEGFWISSKTFSPGGDFFWSCPLFCFFFLRGGAVVRTTLYVCA